MSGLAQISQDDFGVGTLRGSARDVQPGVGLWLAQNVIVNNEGDLVRRGGSAYLSATAGAPITWVWSGVLGLVPVILFTTYDDLFSVDTTTGAVTKIGPGAGLTRPVQPAVINGQLYLPNFFKVQMTLPAGTPGVVAWTPPAYLPGGPTHVAAISGRLVVACANIVGFSGADYTVAGYPTFDNTDYHGLPGGTIVQGLYAVQDTLLVFTTYGMWTVTNMAYDLTDAAGNIQQPLTLAQADLALLSDGGLAAYNSRVVVPASDRVYLVDTVNAPQVISDSIGPLYMDLVTQGCKPGGAKVYRHTLFLPMIDPSDAVAAMLTCRLDQPVQGRQLYFPWTQLAGHASLMRALDVSLTGGAPRLLGGGYDGRVSDLTGVLKPTSANQLDADGVAPALEIQTRDLPTGSGQPNHLRRIRLRYTADGIGAAPDVAVAYVSDPRQSTPPVWTTLPSQPLVVPSDDPLAWWLPQTARARYVRVRFSVAAPTASLVLHRIELAVRSATHAR